MLTAHRILTDIFNVGLWLALAAFALYGLIDVVRPRDRVARRPLDGVDFALAVQVVVGTVWLFYEWYLCIVDQAERDHTTWWHWVQAKGLFGSVADYLGTSYVVPGQSLWITTVTSVFLLLSLVSVTEGHRSGCRAYTFVLGATFIGPMAFVPALCFARRRTQTADYVSRLLVPRSIFPFVGTGMCVSLAVPWASDLMTIFMLALFGPVVATLGAAFRASRTEVEAARICAEMVEASQQRPARGVPVNDVRIAKVAVLRAAAWNRWFFIAAAAVATAIYAVEMRRAMQMVPLDAHFLPTVARSALSHRAAYIMGIDWMVGLTLLGVMFAFDPFVSRTEYTWFLLGSLVLSPMGAMAVLLALRERNLGRVFAEWADGGRCDADMVYLMPAMMGEPSPLRELSRPSRLPFARRSRSA